MALREFTIILRIFILAIIEHRKHLLPTPGVQLQSWPFNFCYIFPVGKLHCVDSASRLQGRRTHPDCLIDYYNKTRLEEKIIQPYLLEKEKKENTNQQRLGQKSYEESLWKHLENFLTIHYCVSRSVC